MCLTSAGVADVFAPQEFPHQSLIDRRLGGEVECLNGFEHRQVCLLEPARNTDDCSNVGGIGSGAVVTRPISPSYFEASQLRALW
jgi:hypothetical protein